MLLKNKLIEDFNNPNELSISTWFNNYNSFINKYKNELNINEVIKYVKSLFKTFDKNNKYDFLLNKFIKNIEQINLYSDKKMKNKI